jgi:hypothetical protein
VQRGKLPYKEAGLLKQRFSFALFCPPQKVVIGYLAETVPSAMKKQRFFYGRGKNSGFLLFFTKKREREGAGSRGGGEFGLCGAPGIAVKGHKSAKTSYKNVCRKCHSYIFVFL